MGIEIYNIINDIAEILNASQMQKLQEVLIKRLSENTESDYLNFLNDGGCVWNIRVQLG